MSTPYDTGDMPHDGKRGSFKMTPKVRVQHKSLASLAGALRGVDVFNLFISDGHRWLDVTDGVDTTPRIGESDADFRERVLSQCLN